MLLFSLRFLLAITSSSLNSTESRIEIRIPIKILNKMLFDIDRKRRIDGTVQFLCMDKGMLIEKKWAAFHQTEGENTFEFRRQDDIDLTIDAGTVHVLWVFRSSLWNHLATVASKIDHGWTEKSELFEETRETLDRYYQMLAPGGIIVVDMPERVGDKHYDAKLKYSTGEMLLRFQRSLKLDGLFRVMELGKSFGRVLVLQKI